MLRLRTSLKSFIDRTKRPYVNNYNFYRKIAIGMAPDEDQITEDIELREADIEEDQSEFIHINVTNEFGEACNVDNM